MHSQLSSSRSLRAFVATGLIGTTSLLAGVAWDAHLHRGDPGLAASEGVLTLTNPGHLLSAVGVILVVVGVTGARGSCGFATGHRLRASPPHSPSRLRSSPSVRRPSGRARGPSTTKVTVMIGAVGITGSGTTARCGGPPRMKNAPQQ